MKLELTDFCTSLLTTYYHMVKLPKKLGVEILFLKNPQSKHEEDLRITPSDYPPPKIPIR